jgi:hypothetical protein
MPTLRHRSVLAVTCAALATTAGCSLLLDTGGLAVGNAGVPRGDDDGGMLDANASDDAAAISDAKITESSQGPVDAATSCPASSSASDPTLVAWYPFEEQSGDVIVDCSGQKLDGKLLPGGQFERIAGHDGRGIDLDGNAGCFDIGPATQLAFGGKPFTVSAWIKPRRFSYPRLDGSDFGPRWIFGHYGEDTNGIGRGWGLGTDDVSEVEFKVFQNDGLYDQVLADIATDKWVHVAGVSKGSGTLQLYVLGALTNEITVPIAGIHPLARGRLGCRQPSEPPFDGWLDDVRVYSRALDATEVAALAK